MSATQTTATIATAPSSGRVRRSACRYAMVGPAGRPASSSTSAHAVAAMHEREAEHRELAPDHDREQATRRRRLARVARRGGRFPSSTSPWSTVMTSAIGISSSPRPRKSRGRFTYIQRRDGKDLAPRAATPARRAEGDGSPGRRDPDEGGHPEEAREHEQRLGRFRSSEATQPSRAPRAPQSSRRRSPEPPPVGTA